MTDTKRRLLAPALMTVAMLIVLLGLGSWQVTRLQWKQAILAEIAQAEAAPPVPMPDRPAPFAKIAVTGTFLPGLAALYGAELRQDGRTEGMGARLIVPLRRDSGETILVDRGWVPMSRPRGIDQPEGIVTVTGYVRPADRPHWFSARNDVAARRFYTLDPEAIGDALGQTQVAPFILVALAPAGGLNAGQWPEAASRLPRPPNNHLVYAITWYGLAVVLMAIFTIWARKGPRA